jgi:hypothetical protein
MKFARLAAAFLLLAQPVLAQSPTLRGAQSSATEARARPKLPASGALINGQSETADAPPRPLAPPRPATADVLRGPGPGLVLRQLFA